MERPFPAYRGDAPYIFVCYAHADSASVYSQLSWLRDQDVNIWYDEGISPGSRWTDDLADALSNCSCLLYFCSPASVESPHCRDEITFALDENVPIIVVQDGMVDLPAGLKLQLGSRQSIVRDELNPEAFAEKLLAAIQARTGHVTEHNDSPPPTPVKGGRFEIQDLVRLPPPRRGLVESALLSMVLYFLVIVICAPILALLFYVFEYAHYNVQPSQVTDLSSITLSLSEPRKPEYEALWQSLERDTRTLVVAGSKLDGLLLENTIRHNFNDLIQSDEFLVGAPAERWRDDIQELFITFESSDQKERLNRLTLERLFPTGIQRWNGPQTFEDLLDKFAVSWQLHPGRVLAFVVFSLLVMMISIYAFTLGSLRITFGDARQVEGVLKYMIGEMGFKQPIRDQGTLVFRANLMTVLLYSVLRLRASIDGNRVILTAPLPMIRRLERTLRASSG
jgi:hypothetical protein